MHKSHIHSLAKYLLCPNSFRNLLFDVLDSFRLCHGNVCEAFLLERATFPGPEYGLSVDPHVSNQAASSVLHSGVY